MSKRKKKAVPLLTLVLLTLVGMALYNYAFPNTQETAAAPQGDFVMQVLDVGQGDAILLSCGGKNMLVDCGEADESKTVLDAVNAAGGTLAYIVATHPHSDHIGGMAKVIRACPPELFLMPEKEHTTKTFENMLDALEEKGVSAEYAEAGAEYMLGEAKITVLFPTAGFESTDLNDWSVVLLVQYGERSILLCGDSIGKAEEYYMGKLAALDVLKVAHHGSSTSTSEAFLKKTEPSYAIISLGAGNDYGHPHAETLALLEKYCGSIYRTDKNGTVTVSISEGNIHVEKSK